VETKFLKDFEMVEGGERQIFGNSWGNAILDLEAGFFGTAKLALFDVW